MIIQCDKCGKTNVKKSVLTLPAKDIIYTMQEIKENAPGGPFDSTIELKCPDCQFTVTFEKCLSRDEVDVELAKVI